MRYALAPLVKVFAALMLAGFVLALLSVYWLATLSVAGALTAARFWRWPQVRVVSYFRTRKLMLPAAAVMAGGGAQWLVAAVGNSPVQVWCAGALTAIGVGLVAAIFEGKIMQNVFDLIPADQQSGFSNFLHAGADMGGKHVDFSRLDPDSITAQIKARVVGQDRAVDEIIPTLFTRARVPRKSKPLATFLFVGPSGTGKSELTKALADALFGDRKLIRLDCAEYVDAHSVDRLIGLPKGYQGSEDGGWLPREMERVGGTGLLMLDEIEKAHPVVLRSLLSLLDEARITEASTQRTYSATGFVIILTSNLRQAEIGKIADGVDDAAEASGLIKSELQTGGFPAEFVGRLDAIFPFRNLDRASIAEIAGRYLTAKAGEVGVRLARVDAGLLIDVITRHEKDSSGGVRTLLNTLERMTLKGMLDAKDQGAREVAITVRNGAVVVEPAHSEAAAGGAR